MQGRSRELPEAASSVRKTCVSCGESSDGALQLRPRPFELISNALEVDALCLLVHLGDVRAAPVPDVDEPLLLELPYSVADGVDGDAVRRREVSIRAKPLSGRERARPDLPADLLCELTAA